jgi:hypothetical protein
LGEPKAAIQVERRTVKERRAGIETPWDAAPKALVSTAPDADECALQGLSLSQ